MELLSRLKSLATAKKLNIVTALVTEGESPESNANPHSRITIKMTWKKTPFFHRVKGFKTNARIMYKIPTCSPETAKICTAPAAAYSL